MKFRIAKPSDAPQIARAYKTCYNSAPNAFLPTLGERFLRQYHRILLSEPASIGLVAEDDAGKVVGFACGTLDASSHLARLKKAKWKLALSALPAIVKNPKLIRAMRERMSAPSASSGENGFVVANGCRLESWGWIESNRAGGQSIQLLRAWLDTSRALGARDIWLEVDQDHVGRIHKMMGAQPYREVVTRDGRRRRIMRYPAGEA
ncbi:MAG: hypothetical protein ACRERE_25415 [Candidatus Entotheonellia bacterium]